MIFAGPSGVGKTELALLLADILNQPGEKSKPGGGNFLKVDCGKLSTATEVFGLSGGYQGAEQGSALNNFILRKSRDKGSLGIVLLDEIEKAEQEVIHALYLLDKGEWTDKKLVTEGSAAQTHVVPCNNIIFVLTTNAATDIIKAYTQEAPALYTAEGGSEAETKVQELETVLRVQLQSTHPFTDAFIGRIDRIVPFLPLARGSDLSKDHPLTNEAMTAAKILIEKEQQKLQNDELELNVVQTISASDKHSMAKLAVALSIEEAGMRSIQKYVATQMGHQMKHALLLEDGGIESGSEVKYAADEEAMRVDWRVEASRRKEVKQKS
ncbi:MAG: hypothetical protein SGARI_005664 [Bacillariaceae sp.]